VSLHCLDLVGTSSLAYVALPHLSCCAAMVVGHRQLGGAIGDGDGQALWMMVVVEEENDGCWQ